MQELGTGEQLMCSEILREGTHLDELQLRLVRTYEANWKVWVSWRSFIGKECWLRKDMRAMELVKELVEFMAYCCAGKGSKESTTVGKLVAINFYHEQFLGLSVPMSNPLIRSVRQGIKRAHVGMGSQQKVKRPLTWGMLTEMQESVQAWGVGGRVLWIGLALTYYFYVASVGIICQRKGLFHKVYCLRRGDVAFFKGNEQLVGSRIHEANKVEVRFKGSKGDQGRKGAVLVRTRTGRGKEGERGAVG